ncbi:MAG: hypothetical protein C4521_11685 [Actinobacteria bacterium]|nr:MAG: hypothetical protein C4521_11685 [Actinomycetota bacterium]
MSRPFSLSLGAAPGNWSDSGQLSLYKWAAARSYIDRLYVGELSCTKRLPSASLVEEVARMAEAAGKEAVLVTPAVLVREEEIDAVSALMDVAPAVEANNLAVVSLWRERFAGKPLLAGAYLDVYNAPAAGFLAGLGLSSISCPVDIELPLLSELSQATGEPLEVSVGRPALAFSWRCYTCRAAGVDQRECGLVCRRRRELALHTLEGEPVWRANGKAVYPHRAYLPEGYLTRMAQSGVGRLRIEPEASTVEEARELVEGIAARVVGKDRVGRGFESEYLAGEAKRMRLRLDAAPRRPARPAATRDRTSLLGLLSPVLIGLFSRGRGSKLEALEGRVFAIRLPARRPLVLRVSKGRLMRAPAGVAPEATVEASLSTFLSIWLGRLDPDAAFFQRRIRLAGSLALALTVKNVFDGVLR